MTNIFDKLKNRFDRKIFSKLLKKIDSLSLTNLDERRRNYIFNYHRNDYKFDKNQIVFIHVPKTGGASIREHLEKNLNNFYIFKKKSEHNPVSLLCSPKDYNYITFLRNPVNRVYSYYNMLKKYNYVPGHDLAKKSLSDLLINSYQVKNLYCQYFSGLPFENVNEEIFNLALSNLKMFYFVGKFEDFNNSFVNLCSKLDLKNNSLIHINKNNYLEISDDQKKLIESYNSYDIKLYKIFFNLST
tara:strand:- start:357 stop:1085 length:729 start_codon:yes stop_codon:yes gene_type:complete